MWVEEDGGTEDELKIGFSVISHVRKEACEVLHE